MPGLIDITACQFGRLTVVRYEIEKQKWLCLCICGKEKWVASGNLRSGKQVSCGCHKRDYAIQHYSTHRLTKTDEYKTWARMKNRCLNPKDPAFINYGGRGIKVCKRWDRFTIFLEDMGARPDGHSLDRIDVNGDYCPANCRWATRVEQANNTRRNRVVNANGKSLNTTQWAKELGIKADVIAMRLKRGWSHDEAINTPLRRLSIR